MKSLLIAALFLFSNFALANSYDNDANNEMYWTNYDLGLEIMRLSYSDTITASGESSSNQASFQTIQNFLAQDNSGWEWANDSEFESIYNWFDTDPASDYWSVDQNVGSSLFFDINGVGTAYSHLNNQGYRDDGYNFWFMSSLTESSNEFHLRYAEIADYGDQDNAYTNSVNSDSGWFYNYFSDNLANTPQNRLNQDAWNEAALLVRRIQVNTIQTLQFEVSEPVTLTLSSLLLLTLFRRRLSRY